MRCPGDWRGIAVNRAGQRSISLLLDQLEVEVKAFDPVDNPSAGHGDCS